MSHQQPAAELIANALAKIKKLAGNKKHAELAQECQKLIDSIHEVRVGWVGCSVGGGGDKRELAWLLCVLRAGAVLPGCFSLLSAARSLASGLFQLHTCNMQLGRQLPWGEAKSG